MQKFYAWDQRSTTGETNEILLRASRLLANRITSTELRERVCASISASDIRGLCELDLDYTAISVHDAIQCRQIQAFFGKRGDIDVGIDRRRVAETKFIEAEVLCRQTNVILERRRRGLFSFSPRVERVIFYAQRKIAELIGDVPCLEQIRPRFGRGATTQVKKRNASARLKLSQKFACSEVMLPLVREALEEMPGWIPFGDSDVAKVDVEVTRGRLDFVPKSYKTDRAIVVEPMLNGMFQMGIGDFLVNRLRRMGIDLTDQTLNQRLAREGSITGALATLDLSSASDTVAYETVFELLPVDWALFLSHFRSESVEYQGCQFRLEKFSSMGNGFTFPLESLIFYGLAYAAAKETSSLGPVNVYGDDIVVPTGAYDVLSETLLALGFLPNKEKSFASGPFRESCGHDYLSGINIRPVYQKTALAGADVFRLHNYFVQAYDDELAALFLEYIDKSMRKYGPDGYGDGHLVTRDPLLEPYGRKKGWGGYVFETYSFRPRRHFGKCLPGDAVLPSYSIYQREAGKWTDPIGGLVRDLSPFEYDKEGRLGVTTPGVGPVRLLKVYTLKT